MIEQASPDHLVEPGARAELALATGVNTLRLIRSSGGGWAITVIAALPTAQLSTDCPGISTYALRDLSAGMALPVKERDLGSLDGIEVLALLVH